MSVTKVPAQVCVTVAKGVNAADLGRGTAA